MTTRTSLFQVQEPVWGGRNFFKSQRLYRKSEPIREEGMELKLKVSTMVRAIFSNLKKVQARKIYLRACTFFKITKAQNLRELLYKKKDVYDDLHLASLGTSLFWVPEPIQRGGDLEFFQVQRLYKEPKPIWGRAWNFSKSQGLDIGRKSLGLFIRARST